MPGKLLAFDTQKHILTTRDCRRFRPLPSPVAPVVHALFNIIRSPQFYAAICASPAPETFPMVAIVQGSARTDSLLANPDLASFPSATAATPQDIHPVDVIFIPFIIHQELLRAIEEEDSVKATQLKIFAVSSVLHEIAHWAHTRAAEGYVPDPERSVLTSDAATDASSQTGKASRSLLELGRRSNDVGVKLTGKFLGFHYELISWTTGHATVVRRRIIKDTAMQTLIPLEEIVGSVTEYPVDVSSLSEARACPPEVSNWIVDQEQAGEAGEGIDLSKVILTRTGPNSMCQHGMCRVN